MKKALLLTAVLMACAARADDAHSLEFLERFARGDRETALKGLVPGTEDYFYFQCLHHQLAGDREAFARVFQAWQAANRNRWTPRMQEMQRRRQLLDFVHQPDETWAFVKRDLSLQFNHRPRDERRPNRAPARIDPAHYQLDAFLAEARRHADFPSQFSERGLDIALAQSLSGEQRRVLLGRLERSDLPGLVDLILDDLQFKDSRGFGHHPVHRLLTRDQLETLARRRPVLMRDRAFVIERLARLPVAGIDFEQDHEAAAAHFAKAWSLVQTLEPMHNPLKASVLFRLLDHQRQLGRYDETLFLAYLELPRPAPYLPAQRRDRFRQMQVPWADFGYQPGEGLHLPPIGDEEPLVRAFLIERLRDAPDPSRYAPYFDARWLDALYAESKILHGVGRLEDWATRLTPAQYRAILDRVELTFVPHNPTRFRPGEVVSLQVDVKRVESVRVNIYEIQTFNYYTRYRAPLDLAVDLDGMSPTHARRLSTQADPARRIRHTLTFPELNARGAYVIELIGGGISSRALITLGQLEAVSQPVAQGLAVMVLDEHGQHLREAGIWLDGREFTADAQGIVLLPYSEAPGPRFIVLRDGDFSSPDRLHHPGETYAFSAGVHLDPQNLPRRQTGRLMLRPDLRINGIPLDPGRLQDVMVTLAAVDARGTRIERQFKPDFIPHAEWETPFYVPDDLRQLDVDVEAWLVRSSDDEKIKLADRFVQHVNQARRGDGLREAFLKATSDGWQIELLGLNGEPIPDTPLSVSLGHPGFQCRVRFEVATDDRGRVELGALGGIADIEATGPGMLPLREPVAAGASVLPERLHLMAGEPVSLPWPFERTPGVKPVSLWRVDGFRQSVVPEPRPVRGRPADAPLRLETILEDWSDGISTVAGELRIDRLPAGDYVMVLHGPEQRIRLSVEAGPVRHGFIVGDRQRLQQTATQLPSLAAIERRDNRLRLQLRNATASTRVALRAARYAGEGSAFPAGQGFPAPAFRSVAPDYALYVSGRNIGDEYRYVLDRRDQVVHAGSLLERPGLLLNPWDRRETTADPEQLKAGDAYRSRQQRLRQAARPETVRVAPEATAMSRPEPPPLPPVQRGMGFDFLPQGAVWQVNLKPDDQGGIDLAFDGGSEHTFLDIVLLDRFGMSRTRYLLPDRDIEPRDVRLQKALNPAGGFSRQKAIQSLAAGETIRFDDLATTRYQRIATLGQAFDLLRALGGIPGLDDFVFLKNWDALDADTKRDRYGAFASHELHLFLHARDPAFFEAVVRPYLSAKKNLTFVDRWLLDRLTPEDTRLDRLTQRNALELALLARRGGDAEAIRVALRDAWELLPPDPSAFDRQMQTALQAAGLDETVADARRREREAAEPASERLTDDSPARGRSVMDMMVAGRAERSLHAEAAPMPAQAPLSLGLREARIGEAVDAVALIEDSFDAEALTVLYTALPPTLELAEQHYYRLPDVDDTPGRIGVSAFWRDVAAGQAPSAHLLAAHRNLTEVLVALAFSGLPFEAEPAAERIEGASLSLSVATPALLASEQILPAESTGDDRPLLLSQQCFRPDDRYRYEGNEQVEKFVSGEFVRRVIYGARVILTNPTESQRRLNLLLQIPQGAIPVNDGFYTDDRDILLDPYATKKIEYFFYFPEAGDFVQFPPHAAIDEGIAARAEARTFRVVEAPTEFDRTAWSWVAQHAEPPEVLAFLAANNPRRLDLDEMAWRLRERDFFEQVWDLLDQRLLAHDTTQSYALFHKDAARARVYLAGTRLAGQVGPVLHSPLLVVEPVERKTYEHLEYDPLVNPRAHPVGERLRILNTAVDAQYRAFLRTACFRATLDVDQQLAWVYYLLLQDRLTEASSRLDALEPIDTRMRLQTDYLQAWLAMRQLDPSRAERLAAPYRDHPVPRWRMRFGAIAQAVAEVRGEPDGASVPSDAGRQQRLDRAADRAPALALSVEGGRLLASAHNLPRATLSLYPIDIELLFSRRPFLAAGDADFAVVRPAYSRSIDLPPTGEPGEIELPDPFRGRDLVVELAARGLRETVTWHASRMRVRLMPDFGQLEVRDEPDGQLQPAVYVKVYGRAVDGQVRFWKDGYTDLRGRFDYLSRNDRQPEDAVRFAILVLHPEMGAVIRETAPPAR